MSSNDSDTPLSDDFAFFVTPMLVQVTVVTKPKTTKTSQLETEFPEI